MIRALSGAVLASALSLLIAGGAHAAPKSAAIEATPVEPEIAGPNAKFWRSGKEGWFWYEDPEFFEEPPPEERQVVDRLLKIEKAEDLRAEVQRLRNLAIMNPSVGNVKTYLYAQQFIMNKASTFADTWRRVVWQTPDLDYSLVRPVNATAINEFKDQRQVSEASFIGDLASQGYGLFFIYSSTCPYCHQMAPMLKAFEAQYGIRVMAISMDGGPMVGFPDARPDNGISQRLNVETVPALYLVSGRDKSVMPIGFGLLAMSDIVERINVLLNTTPGSAW